MNQAIKLMNGNNFALCTHSNTKTSKIEGNIAFFQSLLSFFNFCLHSVSQHETFREFFWKIELLSNLGISKNQYTKSKQRFSGFSRNILFFNDQMNQAMKLMNGNNFALCTHSDTKNLKLREILFFFSRFILIFEYLFTFFLLTQNTQATLLEKSIHKK